MTVDDKIDDLGLVEHSSGTGLFRYTSFGTLTLSNTCLRRPVINALVFISAQADVTNGHTTMNMRSRPNRFDVTVTPNSRLYIDDDEFHWDASLRVIGDFESDEEKRRYAQAIAEALNRAADSIPCRPSEPTDTQR